MPELSELWNRISGFLFPWITIGIALMVIGVLAVAGFEHLHNKRFRYAEWNYTPEGIRGGWILVVLGLAIIVSVIINRNDVSYAVWISWAMFLGIAIWAGLVAFFGIRRAVRQSRGGL